MNQSNILVACATAALTLSGVGTAQAQETRLLCTGISASSRTDLGAWDDRTSGPDWRFSFDPTRNVVRFSSNN